MGIRDQIKEKPAIGYGVGAACALLVVGVMAKTYWPERQADLSKAFYTDDNGQTWFTDSATRVAPFDHNGKPAVVAHVYSYAGGGRQFCAYVAEFTPTAKAKLEAAIADAAKQGRPAESVPLFSDRNFVKTGVLVKKAGPGGDWIAYGDPKANEVFTIKAPDGSVVDEVLP